MKKRNFISLLLPVLLVPLFVFSACGGSAYTKICSYIKDNGDLNLGQGFYDFSYNDNNAGYGVSAWYKINSGETVFAMRISKDSQEENIMISAGGVCESYALAYVISDNDKKIFETDGMITAESLGLHDLKIVLGDEPINENRISELVRLLLLGVDRYIFEDSGIKMSNLGFRY